jgi:hypothetical protein
MLRDDETMHMSKLLSISKNLKISIIWLMKNQSINSIFID